MSRGAHNHPQRYAFGRPRWPVVGMLLLLAFCGAADAALPEYQVKAALIYKISKFVRWPDRAFDATAGVVRLCILGRDDFGADIDGLAGQRLQGQVIEVTRLSAADPGAASCHIAFISQSERDNVAGVLAGLARFPVLTVSDLDNFASQGGMVGLSTVDSKISFQINPAAGRRAGLEIGAQLLQLATLVTDDKTGAKP